MVSRETSVNRHTSAAGSESQTPTSSQKVVGNNRKSCSRLGGRKALNRRAKSVGHQSSPSHKNSSTASSNRYDQLSRSKSVASLQSSPDASSSKATRNSAKSRESSKSKATATTTTTNTSHTMMSTSTPASAPVLVTKSATESKGTTPRVSPRLSNRPRPPEDIKKFKIDDEDEYEDGMISPELLVDALSGQANGLVAITERLMEHYDDGYDAMGEAIIDAFADVQKLFQHVVEAAHMEGAAFEASRREAEITASQEDNLANSNKQNKTAIDYNSASGSSPKKSGAVGSSLRHDELIDQDIKDLLSDAIRKGTQLKMKGDHAECYKLYEESCQSASALLPVDSEHRGRLQLSISRSDATNPSRGCAILKYAMDDVIRSGLHPRNSMLDPNKRSDCVLTRPKDDPSSNEAGARIAQSSEEQLASLVAEMKEVLGAPVYDSTPLQSVASRFWDALAEAQTAQAENEKRLEHDLGKLKGEFLLARAEWEEKMSESKEEAKRYKKKFSKLRDTAQDEKHVDQARASSSTLKESRQDEEVVTHHPKVSASKALGPGSVASIGSSMAQHARTLVREFNCGISSQRTETVVKDEMINDQRRRLYDETKKTKSILNKVPKHTVTSAVQAVSPTSGEPATRQTSEI